MFVTGEIKENEIIEKTDVNGAVHKLICVNGGYFATSTAERGFMPDPRISLPKILDMKMRPDDILICAYPKAGLCFNYLLIRFPLCYDFLLVLHFFKGFICLVNMGKPWFSKFLFK